MLHECDGLLNLLNQCYCYPIWFKLLGSFCKPCVEVGKRICWKLLEVIIGWDWMHVRLVLFGITSLCLLAQERHSAVEDLPVCPSLHASCNKSFVWLTSEGDMECVELVSSLEEVDPNSNTCRWDCMHSLPTHIPLSDLPFSLFYFSFSDLRNPIFILLEKQSFPKR